MIYNNLTLNKEQGNLAFAGRDTIELAQKYGTPLMLLDENGVRKQCQLFRRSAKKAFGSNARVLYAGKALCFAGLYRILTQEEMSVDVVSAGEIYTAVKGGFDMKNSYFHGNNKTDDDIAFALQNNVGYFIVDNFDEAERINKFAHKKGIKQKVLLRLTPGVDAAGAHSAICTGQLDSKFGVAVETGEAEKLVRFVLNLKNIELRGFHCHIGSQVFKENLFHIAADKMIKFLADIKATTGFIATELNLGGGFAVRYVKSQPAVDYEKLISQLGNAVEASCKNYDVKMPAILIEPGRSIVAMNMITLYTVGTIKEIDGIRNYVVVDGGMTDNPRYALYKSEYTCLIANRAGQKANYVATVAGRACESGDILQENVLLAKPSRGDILAVLVTGAYNYSMASNYNRLPRPPIVAIDKNGKDRLLVKRETLDDLIRNDVL